MSEKSAENKKSIKKPLIICGSVAAAVIVLLLVAVIVLSGNGIAKGVTIGGKSVAGMSVKEATEFIGREYSDKIPSDKITVEFKGSEYELSPEEVFAGYDVEKSVTEAYKLGRGKNAFGNFFERCGLFINKKDIPVEPIINDEPVKKLAAELTQSLESPKVDDYYFMEEDRIKLVFGKAGDSVDAEAFAEKVKSHIINGEKGNIVLEAVIAEPKTFNVDEIYAAVATPPTSASFEEVDGKKHFIQAQKGYDFKKEELQSTIDSNRGVCESFYFTPTVTLPEQGTVDESGLFTEVLSQYTSKITDSDRSRLNNVNLAASKINGIIVNPGEEFAYLKHVEPITVEGGYKSANVYANGKIEKGIGGGVCQVSSALYSAVLNANLEVTKRYAHSLTVGYVPLGQDATVASGEIDFRFINNTDEPMKIVANSDSAGVYITLKGKKKDPSVTVKIENVTTQTLVPETIVEIDETLEPGEEVVDYYGKTGYTVQTYKHVYKDGVFVETIHVSTSRYRKIDKTVRRGPDAAETVTDPQNPAQEPSTDSPETSVEPETPGTTETPEETEEPVTTDKPTDSVEEDEKPATNEKPDETEESEDEADSSAQQR